MRPSLAAILAVLICIRGETSANASADPHLEPADVDEFIKLEAVWNDAHLKGDADALEQLWSDDIQIIVPRMAVMTKSDGINFVRSGRMKFDRYSTSNVKVRRYGDTVVVTGRMKRSRSLNNGHLVDDDWQFTKVYSHTAGYWRVVIFQASEPPVS